MIRGGSVPVVDLRELFVADSPAVEAARFVTIKLGRRWVALAVDLVEGARTVHDEILEALPPLLGPAGAEVFAAIGNLDAELLLVLRASNLVPDSLWEQIEA